MSIDGYDAFIHSYIVLAWYLFNSKMENNHLLLLSLTREYD